MDPTVPLPLFRVSTSLPDVQLGINMIFWTAVVDVSKGQTYMSHKAELQTLTKLSMHWHMFPFWGCNLNEKLKRSVSYIKICVIVDENNYYYKWPTGVTKCVSKQAFHGRSIVKLKLLTSNWPFQHQVKRSGYTWSGQCVTLYSSAAIQ